MYLCLAAEQKPGMRLSRQWWEKPTLDILWIIVEHAAAEVGTGTGTEESEVEGEGEYDREGWR